MSKGPKTMRIGFFQFDPVFGEIKRNLSYVLQHLEKVDADLIVLPEFFASGYQFISRKEAADLSEEARSGPTTR